MRAAQALLSTWLVLGAAACTSSSDELPGAAACAPGNATFGARCCDAGDCGQADLVCRSGQCTKPCDGGTGCEGLAVDGGARPCSSGYCIPPPPPVKPGQDDGSGW